MSEAESSALRRLPLHTLHESLGARFAPFADFLMPASYPEGVIAEHLRVRRQAGLFDVSHMGQLEIVGDEAAAALERLAPMDVLDMKPGTMRYGLLTNDGGGVIDDVILSRRSLTRFCMVVNASRREFVLAHLRERASKTQVREIENQALLALQGPAAAEVMGALAPDSEALVFMSTAAMKVDGVACQVSRCGYSGEDGFEISLPAADAETLARRLLDFEAVGAAGLGARNTLRLEAGLCLYGSELDKDTTPVEAGLQWSIPAVRRIGGARAGGFPGARRILRELRDGVARRRIGLMSVKRVPLHDGDAVYDANGRELGKITSGSYAPSLKRFIAMAYADADVDEVEVESSGRRRAARRSEMPFVTPHYRRRAARRSEMPFVARHYRRRAAAAD